MKKINLSLSIVLILAISGCVTGSKTVKPSSNKADTPAPKVIEEKRVSEAPIVVSNVPAKQPLQVTQAVYKKVNYNPVAEPAKKTVNKIQSKKTVNKIQYSQIANLISEFIDIKEKDAIAGENSYAGVSENNLTILEIKGDKNDVKEASMKLIYPKGIDKVTAELNNAMMSRFLKNAAPEFSDWHSRIKEILNKFYSLETGSKGIETEDVQLSDRVIHILYDKNADYIVVTMKPQP
jgi:hypothetical protein